MCQGCYHYFSDGGQIHRLPQYATIQYDDRGYVICHICGRSYKRLGSHVKESHQISIAEYKEEFGICNKTKTTESTYSLKMSELAITNNMPERLSKTGVNTRFKIGDKTRLGVKIKTQEYNRLIIHVNKIRKSQ